MKRNIFIAVAIFLLSLILTDLVVAAYYIDIDVEESNGTDYDMLAMNVSMDIDYLATNGFIYPDGLDVRVENSQGSPLPFMLTEDKLMFASAIDGDKTTGFQMTTGNTQLVSFPVIVGDGGYVTITDHANLELADDFEIEVDGYIDISATDGMPNVDATTTSTEDTATTSHTVDLPSGVASGDLLIVVFSGMYGSGTPVMASYPPSGWTSLWNLDGTSGDDHVSCGLYRVASGGEGSTLTLTTSAICYSAHQSLCISNYQGSPESSESSYTSGTANPDPPSNTVSWGEYYDTLWIAGFAGNHNVATTVSSDPANYSDRLYIESGAGYAQVGTARREYATATENPATFTVSQAINVYTFTIGVQGGRGSRRLIKEDSFLLDNTASGELTATILGGTPKSVVATGLTGVEKVTIWADGANLGIDIDDVNEDTEALSGVSAPDNANDWELWLEYYYDYYTHTTTDTLRITYAPDDIISGTTLINETNPGTHDGTITWGANPAGISISTSGLLLDESYYYTGGEGGTTDIFEPEPAELAPGLDNDKLDHNPLSPGVEGFAEASNGAFTESLVWYGGAWFILIAVGIALVILVREHLVFAGAVCFGLAIMFYVMGIFDYWVLIILGIFFGATLIHERMPTW